MTLDPNQLNFSDLGRMTESTLLTQQTTDVVLRQVARDESNGRTCFEVVQSRFTDRMCLVFPRHPSGTYRLVIGSPHVRSVVLLEADALEPQLASVSRTTR